MNANQHHATNFTVAECDRMENNMGEADLSKIVGLIMENPSLIAEIRALADGETKSDTKPATEKAEPSAAETAAVTETVSSETAAPRSRRRELLSALKPYLSEERCRAVDQMISLGEILDMMRNK